MPPLDEGTLMYMPSTLPGISVAEAQKLMQLQDRIIKRFPEVASVMGKAGRAETSTDPAPLSMMETIIVLKPAAQWRKGKTTEQLIDEMNEALKLPGVSNAWTMPIKARIDMLTTGIRTPVGVKIYGADIQEIQRLGTQIESLLPRIRGTRNVFAERTGGGYFLDFDWKRAEMARYGLSMEDVQGVLMSAVGGENVTTTVEGRERYPVNVRYLRDYRSDLNKLGRWCPCREARRRFRSHKWRTSSCVRGRRCCVTKTECSTATSMWTLPAATSEAMSRRRRMWSAAR
jgi:Cu(I)/Ag(I) efflux system membrane protein CusA/SilA